MTWFYATSVSVTNGATVVSVNAGDDIALAQGAGGLVIGTQPPVEIKRTYLDGSSNKKIELLKPWPYGSQTNQPAAAFPTDGDLAAATAVLKQLIDGFTLATQAEAQAGTENTKPMTALRVKQAMDALLGSASKLTAAVGQSDTTIGRALKVGDFSLGKTGALINLPVSTLDELNVNGSFSVAGNTPGWPFGGSGGVVTHRSHGDGLFSVQEAAEAQSERIAVRFRQVTGSWTSWGFVYHTRNALGTVAFSSGENAGAIIESGSNPNGTYMKLADGTLICQFNRTGSLGTSNYSASLPGLKIGFFYWFFPAQFVSAPSVTPAGVDNVSTGWASAQVGGGSQATIQYYTTTTNPTDTLICLTAIGRWR